MSINQVKVLVTRRLLIVSLLLGIVALTATTGQAQHCCSTDGYNGRVYSRVVIYTQVYPRQLYRYNYSHPFYPIYYYTKPRVTQDQGYLDGLRDGRDDAENRKPYYPNHHRDYKKAETSGYYGGYLQGYEEGYH